MTKTIEIDIAQAKLGEIIAGLGPGDEVLLVQNRRPVARLLPPTRVQPQFGSCQGLLTVVAEDDEHLKDFEDYLPSRSSSAP
jgi:antitoxin (DNA-binding transcriptional repressor) of toxin-antitoxin stability system